MKRLLITATAACACILLASCSDPVAPAPSFQESHSFVPEFDFRALDVPDTMGFGTSVFGINNEGTMVGNYVTLDNAVDGFVFTHDRFLDVALPNTNPFNRGVLNAINDEGTAVGSFIDAATGVQHDFMRDQRGRITVMPDPVPGQLFREVLGINNRGTAVGRYRSEPHGPLHGFFFSRGVYRTYDHPDATFTSLEGINDAGVAVGNWVDAGHVTHGFMLEGSQLTAIDPPGAVSTIPRGINNRRAVAGTYLDATFTFHGFLYRDGVFTVVDFPGADDTEVLAINDRGAIAGSYDQFSRGFVAWPDR